MLMCPYIATIASVLHAVELILLLQIDLTLEEGSPYLKLHQSCRVMLPSNQNVINGLDNGTQAILKNVTLRPHVTPTIAALDNGYSIPAVFASQVEIMELECCNN